MALDLPADAPFVTVALNGAAVRLRVDFAAPGLVLLRPSAARRLGLGATGTSTMVVGPVVLPGLSGAAMLSLEGRARPVRLLWNDRAPTDDDRGIDGVVSPGALPVDTVRLVRDTPRPTRTTTLPARFDPAAGLFATQRIDGRRIEVRLSPARPDTLASAAAGAAIARQGRGRLSAAVDRRTILFGIARPVGAMTLDRPITVAGRPLVRLLVRGNDYAGSTAPPPVAAAINDGDEVVVTGRVSGRARYRLDLGADLLGRCAAIGWQARTRRLTLDCA